MATDDLLQPIYRMGTFTLVPEGDYLVQVDDLIVNESKEEGKANLQAVLRIDEGEHEGELLNDFFSLVPDTRGRVLGIQRLMGLLITAKVLPDKGYKMEVFTERKNITRFQKELIGKRITVTVKHRPGKQLKDDGTPFLFANVVGYAPLTTTTEPTPKKGTKKTEEEDPWS